MNLLSNHEEAMLKQAISTRFSDDANISGYLLNADIGPTGWGNIYNNDSIEDGAFTKIECIGTDNRNGYDIVQTTIGNFVIVTYDDSSNIGYKKLEFLEAHIKANPYYYKNLKLKQFIKNIRDEILYPLAHENNELSIKAECFGQTTIEILKH